MRKSEFDMSMPLFFKVWFAFVAIMAIITLGLTAWFGASLVSNPQIIGEWVGGVVYGFNGVQK